MPRAVIADSDEEEDEDSFSLPTSPESGPPGRPVIDLTNGASSQDVPGNTGGATSSTDPAFFQSVLDEHRAAARNFASRGSVPVAYTDQGGHDSEGCELADSVGQVGSFEMNAPGTSRKVETGFAVMVPSSATNPATQRSCGSTMARLKSSAPRHGLWDVPSSTEEAEVGARLDAVRRPPNSVSADSNGSQGDNGRRERRLLSKSGTIDKSLRNETTELQLKRAHRESLPSTLSIPDVPSLTSGQRKVSTRSHYSVDEYAIGFDGGTDDTNAFSTGERQRRIDQVDELPSAMPTSSHDALAPGLANEKAVHEYEDTTMDEAADSPNVAVAVAKGPDRTRSKRRQSSSPDIISNNSLLKVKTKTFKARRTRKPAAGYAESEEEGSPIQLVEDDSAPEEAHKPSSVRKRRVVLDDEGASLSDAPIQEVYAEEDYDTDFVDAPKKPVKKQPKKRGRPKKRDKDLEDDIGPEGTVPQVTKNKRGRPRRSGAKNQTTQNEEPESTRRPADGNDEAHDVMKNEIHEQDGEQDPTEDAQAQAEEEDDQGVDGQGADEEQSEADLNEKKLVLEAVESGDQSEAISAQSEQEAANKTTARPEENRSSSLAAAIAMTSKPLYRVGLSKRSRIAPLLKSLRKPGDEPPVVANKGGKRTKQKDGK